MEELRREEQEDSEWAGFQPQQQQWRNQLSASSCSLTSVQQGGTPQGDGWPFPCGRFGEDVEDVVAAGVQRVQHLVGDSGVADELDLPHTVATLHLCSEKHSYWSAWPPGTVTSLLLLQPKTAFHFLLNGQIKTQ